MSITDPRAAPQTKHQLKLSNMSTVLAAFEPGEKLTITELAKKINRELKEIGKPDLSERTIRRAVNSLREKGFLKSYGRKSGATLYGRIDTSFAAVETNEGIIAFGGNLVSVEDFLRMMTDPENDPLRGKFSALSVKRSFYLRRLITFVVMSSGVAGYNDHVGKCKEQLFKFIDELQYVTKILESFANSSIWYDVYRDRVAGEIRGVQKRNPELFQLAVDFAKEQGTE